MIKILKYSLVLTAVLLLLFSTWFAVEFNQTPDTRKEGIRFEVLEGQSVSHISRALKKQGVIKKAWPFLLGYRLFFAAESLKAPDQ